MGTLFPEELFVWRDRAGLYHKISELPLVDQLVLYGILAGGVVAVLSMLPVNWLSIIRGLL